MIVVDLRGHGRSSVPEDGYEPKQFAADIAGLLEQLDVGPVVAMGHSLGGAIVSALAVERPELVSAVVSVDPGYLLPDEVRPVVEGMAAALATTDPVAAAQQFLSASYSTATPAALKSFHMRRIAACPGRCSWRRWWALRRTGLPRLSGHVDAVPPASRLPGPRVLHRP